MLELKIVDPAKISFTSDLLKKYQLGYFFVKFVILFLMFILSVSCNSQEDIKKIDLSNTFEQKNEDNKRDNNTIYLGFDLRWEPIEDLQFYAPLIKYLTSSTGLKIKIVVPRTYSDNIHMLGQGKIDISFMGTVNCLISGKQYGSYPILLGLNGQNEPFYRGAIVKKYGNNKIRTLQDIKNKKFAFGNRYSTQGYLIPRKLLEDEGISLELIDYEFSESHKDVAYKIINGFCDAGAIQDKLAIKMAKENLLEIIKLSDRFPSSTVCVSPTLSIEKVDILKNALLKFNPKNDVKNNLWQYTEMENGFMDVNNVDLKDLFPLIKRYYNLK